MNDIHDHRTAGRLVTLTETAQRLRVSKALLHRLIRERELPSIKIGSRRFILEPDLDRFIARQRVAAREGARHG